MESKHPLFTTLHPPENLQMDAREMEKTDKVKSGEESN